jgi:putative ABC transport system permease protein
VTPWRLMTRNLRYYWRTNIVVVIGLALAVAVICGSLLVGDSVTGSLRDSALARLGRIDHSLIAPHFFRAQLAGDLARDSRLRGKVRLVVPLVVLRGAVESTDNDMVFLEFVTDCVDQGKPIQLTLSISTFRKHLTKYPTNV